MQYVERITMVIILINRRFSCTSGKSSSFNSLKREIQEFSSTPKALIEMFIKLSS